VVADVSSDLDGEAETGSMDMEERNHLARSTIGSSQAVIAVGAPGVRGVRGLVTLLGELTTLGVDPDRILPVVNHAPRSTTARREAVRAITELAPATRRTPLAVRTRRDLESIHHAVDPLPRPLCQTLAVAVAQIAVAAPSPAARPVQPAPLVATRTAS
jgi:hypothetical protein